MKFKRGKFVRIGRYKVKLLGRMGDDYEGGWWVYPPIEGLRCWNEDAMKPWRRDETAGVK